jgi:hypothetical protein
MNITESKYHLHTLLISCIKLLEESQKAVDQVIYKNSPNQRIKFHQVKSNLIEEKKRLHHLWDIIKNLD